MTEHTRAYIYLQRVIYITRRREGGQEEKEGKREKKDEINDFVR